MTQLDSQNLHDGRVLTDQSRTSESVKIADVITESVAAIRDDICYAQTYVPGEIKGTHKPEPGMYDGKPIVSCVWCGKTLKEETACS